MDQVVRYKARVYLLGPQDKELRDVVLASQYDKLKQERDALAEEVRLYGLVRNSIVGDWSPEDIAALQKEFLDAPTNECVIVPLQGKDHG